jgi:hypothetical protein
MAKPGIPKLRAAPPAYTVPEGLRPKKRGVGRRILAGVGTAMLAPVYLGVGLLVAVPSVAVGGYRRVRAPKGKKMGSFMEGFASVYKPGMGWLNKPLYGMVSTVANPGRAFYVDRTTKPGEVILTARVFLRGKAEDVAAVKSKEKAIEEHFAIDGYAVNVEFVDAKQADAVTVDVVPNAHPDHNTYSTNANPGVYAHEMMHAPFGLLDQYDLRVHYQNGNMRFANRLGVFFHSLVQPTPLKGGIMAGGASKPLLSEYEALLRGVGEAP